MIKLSSIDPTEFSDESGRKIYISTATRRFFRQKFESDFGKTPNEALNRIIGEDVSNSSNLKNFIPSTGSVAEKKRELGVIKKSANFGVYYFCISSAEGTRVITVKESIKEGKPPQEYGSRVSTGVMDPKHGREIRVNTTVRNIFREDYKTMAFPPDPIKTFQNAGILELSKYIADLYAKNSNKIRKVWKTPSRSENIMEIRTFGSNQFFVTILDESYCDIISVQDQFLSEKTKKYREEKVKKEWAPSRSGKGERTYKKDYLR
jgi:hypothetical protein